MSDRMPGDLPVRKCINVMVGITRSKVIFYAFGTCVSPRRIFLRLGHLCLVQVYLFYTRMEIGLVRLLRVYFLPRALCIFLERAFLDCTCGSKNHIFKLHGY